MLQCRTHRDGLHQNDIFVATRKAERKVKHMQEGNPSRQNFS